MARRMPKRAPAKLETAILITSHSDMLEILRAVYVSMRVFPVPLASEVLLTVPNQIYTRLGDLVLSRSDRTTLTACRAVPHERFGALIVQ